MTLTASYPTSSPVAPNGGADRSPAALRRRPIGHVLALLVALAVGAHSAHAQEGVIDSPGVYAGVLEEADEARFGGPRYDEWVLEVPAGAGWRVVMEAQYDTYLEWTLPEGSEGHNDDAEGLNAGTTFSFTEPTRVILRASSFGSSARGAYELLVSVASAGADGRPSDLPAGTIPPPVALEVPASVDGELSPTDPRDRISGAHFDRYELTLRPGAAWEIVMDAEYDTLLEWETARGSRGQADDFIGLRAGVVLVPDEPVTLTLTATSFERSTGPYRLSVARLDDVSEFEERIRDALALSETSRALEYEQAALAWSAGRSGETSEAHRALTARLGALFDAADSAGGGALATGGWQVDSTTRIDPFPQASEAGGGSSAEITVSLSHSGIVRAIALAPEAGLLATGSHTGEVRLWDAESGRLIRSFDPADNEIEALAISPDGSRIAYAIEYGALTILDSTTGDELAVAVSYWTGASIVEFSPDGRSLIAASTAEVAIWDERGARTLSAGDLIGAATFDESGERIVLVTESRIATIDAASGRVVEQHRAPVQPWVGGAALSPDGRYALLANQEMLGRSEAALVATGSGAVVRRLHADRALYGVTALALSSRQAYFMSFIESDPIVVFDLADGAITDRVAVRPGLDDIDSREALLADPAGEHLYYGFGPRVERYDLLAREHLEAPALEPGWRVVSLAGEGEIAASGTRFGTDGVLTLWNVESGRLERVTRGIFESFSRLDVAAFGDFVLADGVGESGAVLIDATSGWDVRRYRSRSAEDSVVVSDIGVFPSGDRVAVAPDNEWRDDPVDLSIHDLRTEAMVATLVDPEYDVDLFAISPTGSLIATLDSGQEPVGMRLWDAGTMERVATLRSPVRSDQRISGGYSNIAFVDDERTVVVAAYGSLLAWDTRTGELVLNRRLPGADVFALAPSSQPGRLIAIDEDARFREIDLATGRVERFFDAEVRPAGADVSFDGRRAVLGSTDGALRVYDLERGELLTTSVATPDGDWLTWTPEGYFTGSERAMRELVYVVDGLEILSIDRFRQSYYRPDLVRVKLAGEELVAPSLTEGSTRPPLVELLLEHRDGVFRPAATASVDELRVSGGRVRARVIATDQGGGISAIQVQNNVKTVDELRFPRGAGTRTVEATFDVPLVDRENFLNAAAYSGDGVLGLSDFAPLTFDATSAEPTLWIVAVGIDHYENGRYDLNYAVEDASAIAERLADEGASIFSRVERRLITTDADRFVSRRTIVEALEEVAERAEPQDVFVFFYSGHGIALAERGELPAFHFVPSDVTQMTDAELVRSGGISGEEFANLVQEIQAQKQLHILDACNSGAAVQAFAFRSSAEEQALQRLSQSSGTALIAASRREQFAIEIDALGQGALTRALIDGLAGAAMLPNGEITVASLRSYVDLRVPELTGRFAVERQQPTGFLNGQDFPLAVRARSAQ